MGKIGFVTGASGGIGQLFVQELIKETIDEIWVVGRSEKRLLSLKEKFGVKIILPNWRYQCRLLIIA